MSNYNLFDKILHKQFLQNNNLSNYLYERILNNSKKSQVDINGENIFITGLARSGTTALLNKIYSSGEFGSLLYRFMPFILIPELASKFYGNKLSLKKNKQERFHKDGILININSPECLDEVFWIKALGKYYENNELKPVNIDSSILKAYSYLLDKYNNLQSSKRMLVKNNNNHLRLNSLIKYFKDSTFLFTFREPLSHAKSLLKQHHNFINIQNQDKFILEYMNMIGHFEFGKGIKSFTYNDFDLEFGIEDQFEINYWLIQWINTHNWILKSEIYKNSNFLLINYEELCNGDELYKSLCKKLNIKESQTGKKFRLANKKQYPDNLSESLLSMAMDTYYKLRELSFR